ncbi:DUF664 domain-containing protein [Streptomyces sp. ISL-66]|uniref:DUF664 domain-containing protein n=1 Tax=Streptomyces sp. ISL-66 TaxID=2819186 RepID=UPI001BE58168|nr:DUF664 domain-containing protein [Streptomyces sp. ISL-66]MBT2469413.1 DUF664 domain-containing protein [Streptomyces sp. ISL-66]
MIDAFAKDNLHGRLRRDREALLWKLDGLSEYDADHVLGESIRHAGHADILREGLDGRTGLRAEHEKQIDEEASAAYCAKIERAARSAAPIKA